MINGFEPQTEELNEYEKTKLLPRLIDGFEGRIGKKNAITSNKICQILKGDGFKINPARLRKVIHEIRITGAVENLIATKKGYYISNDKAEMQKYVDSLHQRENSIANIRKQLTYQMDKLC